MNALSEADIRRFLLDKYREPIGGVGLVPEKLADDFDFLLSGVIDSFGILEMIGAIEKEFEIELDLEALDADQITVLGPLSRYVAEHGSLRNALKPDQASLRGGASSAHRVQ
jgi:acyl carrier protein